MDPIDTERQSGNGPLLWISCTSKLIECWCSMSRTKMSGRWWWVLLLISSVLGTNQNRPHIIFILADDLVSISGNSALHNDVSVLKGTLHKYAKIYVRRNLYEKC